MSQTNDFGVNQDSIAVAPSDETADINLLRLKKLHSNEA